MNKEILEFEINPDIVQQFQSDLDNLVKVSQTIKFKIVGDRLMMYAFAGEKRTVHAFKSYIYDRDEFMINQNDEEMVCDFIIINARRFAQSLKILTAKGDDINVKIEQYEGEKVANRVYFNDSKTKMNFLGGSYLEIRDYSIDEIEQTMDPELADFRFTLDNEDYKEINRLARLNKNEIVKIRVINERVEFFDTHWSTDVGAAEDYEDSEWMFDVKYYKSINNNNDLTFYVFNQSLLIKSENEIYMIALQLNI